jgi:hypothetical protein
MRLKCSMGKRWRANEISGMLRSSESGDSQSDDPPYSLADWNSGLLTNTAEKCIAGRGSRVCVRLQRSYRRNQVSLVFMQAAPRRHRGGKLSPAGSDKSVWLFATTRDSAFEAERRAQSSN